MPKQTFTAEELRYLKLLAREYPTVQAASTEIINLQAILNLPKGTEHFVSDVHGEYEAFLHILNSCSGVIKEKIDDVFASILLLRPAGAEPDAPLLRMELDKALWAAHDREAVVMAAIRPEDVLLLEDL